MGQIRQIDGVWFPADDTHFEEWAIEQKRSVLTYQQEQRDYAYRFVKDFRCAVDVGAHVGLFSMDFARNFTMVKSFEPMSDLRACLKRNVPQNVKIFESGLSDVQKVATIGQQSPGNTGDNGIGAPGETIVLNMLDSFLFKRVDLIKIDVQGHELNVLKGAENTLRRHKPVVILEEKALTTGYGELDDRIIRGSSAFLKQIGFRPKEKIGADRVWVPR